MYLPLTWHYGKVERHAVKGLLILVERERQGESVDRPLLQSLLRMLHSLGTYAEAFQRPFLERSTRFYHVEGSVLMNEMAVSEYLKHCEVGLNSIGGSIGKCYLLFMFHTSLSDKPRI